MMAPGARATIPGRMTLNSRADVVQASPGRDQWVRKCFERADVGIAREVLVVYLWERYARNDPVEFWALDLAK